MTVVVAVAAVSRRAGADEGDGNDSRQCNRRCPCHDPARLPP
eukprot:CAMPEP_0171944512 /NCGR_PEP_ID=MMETSP0993-20121228/43023_1 /TAXON_ID=483369 /ORGANISM="non described non described, Strain CCMP2098" /LENGTH=41 /DNA_ID= /DNA_START= /DNA_END= /DNA_ORIENTATION=